jgi:hypothetical protein
MAAVQCFDRFTADNDPWRTRLRHCRRCR